ncbi:MAG TPA: NAD-binding protein [Propionibacteriaceae bacterium]|nr:NAD-binding protein [Propionibacteriaceae bacterium]
MVAIGSDQQSSILTTALLTDLGIGNICAKALDRQHAKILERIGAHHAFQPEHKMGERVAHLLSGQMQDYVEVDEDWPSTRQHRPGSWSVFPWASLTFERSTTSLSSP